MASILPVPLECGDCDCGDNVTVSGGGGTTTINYYMQEFDTLVDMRASVVPTARIPALLLGLNSPDDGNGGVYHYNFDSVAADDGISIIKLDDVTGAGRYIKLL